MASLPPTELAKAANPPNGGGDLPTTTTHRRILACVRCQQRKIKCSRTSPCSHCLRAKVQCVPATPAPPHRRRRPPHALKERLARCEELLGKYMDRHGEVSSDNPAACPPRQPQDIPDAPPISKWTAVDGKLVEETDGKVAFIDNYLIGLVYDELRAMRDFVNTEESNESGQRGIDTVDDDNAGFVLGGASPREIADDIWPDATLIFRLWQIFLDRVNPLTKVIHVPSFQPYVVEATKGPQDLPDSIAALMLAIFLMATISLSETECENFLQDSKTAAMNRFSSGVRQRLRRIGILQTKDLAVLQALVLYLISLQGYNRHSAWVLNGLVIRIAQKMGLHRDGELLGLKPFESEMRRRVWWQVIAIDTKFALFSGLGHSLLPRDWDVREPGNLNDADMFPSATQPFLDRDGPTEMILCLVQCKITKFLVETPGLEPVKMMSEFKGLAAREPRSDALRDQQIRYYRTHFDILEQSLHTLLKTRCDPSAGQIHKMARGVVTTLLDQKKELINGLGQPPEPDKEVQCGQDDAFKSAVAMIEHATSLYASTENTGFVWFVLLNVQLDVFLFMVVQLGHRTEGQSVERAWYQVGLLYKLHHALFDLTNRKFWRLAHYVLRAWAKRREVLGGLGCPPSNPEYIDRLQKGLGYNADCGDLSSSLEGPMPLGEAGLECGRDCGRAMSVPLTPHGEGIVNLGEEDWSFLTTMAAVQGHEPTSSTLMGYGVGPWAEW